MDSEKLEAVGQRGEACIIVVRRITLANGETAPAYSLASGERLVASEGAREFATLDGKRSFKLRD